MAYDPARRTTPEPHPTEPLEVSLALDVPACGTCDFFWPQDPDRQPYGPYPSYDFDSNAPNTAAPPAQPTSYKWVSGTTRPPCFPNAEIMDGCRKAPIMTIGINPNLTAFLPGRTSAAWCYPSFSSDGHTNATAKYAYYYRYRSVYQERLDASFVQKYLLPNGRVIAPKSGVVISAERPNDAPGFSINVRYDGDAAETPIALPSRLGEARYVLLFDIAPPNNRFHKGDLIAARLDVPAGVRADVYAQQIGYYERMRPVLDRFQAFLQQKGHHAARLQIGEDVGQLDMVACASPHWGPPWLGGSAQSVHSIIANCVSRNAWALKQLLQTQPAVLFMVGEASYSMFKVAFGRLISPELPSDPEDGAFTLLRATTDSPRTFAYTTAIDGRRFSLSTRLVVTPHFSYGTNFLPQFRLSQAAWATFKTKYAECAEFLGKDPRLHVQTPQQPRDFVAVQIVRDEPAVMAHVQAKWPAAEAALRSCLCDAFQSLSGILEALYNDGSLTFTASGPAGAGYLARSTGPCRFCVNDQWHFPQGCPYGKPSEAPLPSGFLEKVAAEILRSHVQSASPMAVRLMVDDGFEARRAAD